MKNPRKSLEKPKIVVILGPTSAGKSAVAIRLAQKFNGEIISVDSRQIYRGMDVGTGKVPRDPILSSQTLPAGRQVSNLKSITYISERIPHHMIDIVSPRRNFSAAEFKKKADKAIKDILKRGKLPILCGGTGFWIKSIVDNVTYPEVKPDLELRKRLEIENAEKLFLMLEELDPERAKTIDAKNKVRLIRAIEICKAIGKVPPPMRNHESDANLRTNSESKNFVESNTLVVSNWSYEFLQIGIEVKKEKLHEKIRKRLDERWKSGMIEEVQKLHKQGLSWKKIQSFGLGYFWIPEYLHKKITLEELYEKVYLAEKDYAKRQMTWFKKDQRIKWLENFSDIQKEVEKFLFGK